MATHIITVFECDVCGAKDTEDAPVTKTLYRWLNKDWEIDLCEMDKKKVEDFMEELTYHSRREMTEPSRVQTVRRNPYSLDSRFDQYRNDETGRYVCPYTWTVENVPHACKREFVKPNGLAVHYSRIHGATL